MYQDLSTRHGWPAKKSYRQFASQVEVVNSKCISSNALNSLRTQNKDLGTASQTLLTKVKLFLQQRLLPD